MQYLRIRYVVETEKSETSSLPDMRFQINIEKKVRQCAIAQGKGTLQLFRGDKKGNPLFFRIKTDPFLRYKLIFE